MPHPSPELPLAFILTLWSFWGTQWLPIGFIISVLVRHIRQVNTKCILCSVCVCVSLCVCDLVSSRPYSRRVGHYPEDLWFWKHTCLRRQVRWHQDLAGVDVLSVTESKLDPLTTGQASQSGDEVEGIMTSFRKPADWEYGRLMSQSIIVPKSEFKLLLY